ncbi:HAMP domain-containing sensor histidine kinase [Halodesulfovibrio spirochaetisodalis]|uniref:histidine kinase n=1 Tax=Halodesulfovibrio spirochaetisodalis TaxID=1560234 RepID=A0A1B7XG88_9BACT|nr:HAMP domain-containing sensor histidine kinase [Halodesulfovibrio spirochaetisodalis]OBQ54533.1 hypothetical protein SP90_05630 [Halodesulfovibrio spirochaetisodalis]
MLLKSISAKLTATFIFILALSLAFYVILFSITMHRDAERSTRRSLPMIVTLLQTEFSSITAPPDVNNAEVTAEIAQRIPKLKKILQADYMWVVRTDGSIIKSKNAVIPEHHLTIVKEMCQKTKLAVFQSLHTEELQALLFPLTMGGKPTTVVIVQHPTWPSHKILLDFLVPTAGTGLLIGLFVLPLIFKTLRPLKELEATVINFATGDLSERAVPVHNDEVGRLSRTFNMMADNLEQMTRFRHELTANISHELRSPLTRIQMSEELAFLSCEQENYSNVKKHLHAVRTEVAELDGLIEEILKLSKLEMNTQIGEIGACDITNTLRRLMRKNAPIIERKHLNVQTDYSHDCVITCNYPMVNLALSNLVSNALKFSPEKGLIRVNTISNPQTVSIEVFNTFYRSFSTTEQVAIFEPFARAEGENIPGTGLGLALVAKVAEQHEGSVTVQNQVGGILFTLTLPRVLASHENVRKQHTV